MSERDAMETIIPEINPVKPGDRFVMRGDDLPFTAPQHDLHEAGYREHDPATCRNGDHYGQCSGVTR